MGNTPAPAPTPTAKSPLWTSIREEIQEVLPFFVLLTLALGFIFTLAVFTHPALRQPSAFVPFIFLALLHVVLHWTSPLLRSRPHWVLPYLAFQGALAFTLTWLSADQSVLIGLYMALIGESFGVLPTIRARILAVITYLALSAVSFFLLAEETQLSTWALTIIPISLFIVVYVNLFRRQAEASEEARALLKELETANALLAEYAAQVEELTRATERQRMARELHDTLSQGVAGLILQLEAADAHLSAGRSERAGAIIRQAMSRARSTLADARRAIDDLRQEPGSDSNLKSAIQEEVERFSSATGIECKQEIDLPEGLPAALGEQILRCVAEALNNVARHARASQVSVSVRPGGHSGQPGMEVEVRDNGVGFDPDQTVQRPGHYGLLGMRERARLAGGSFELDSAPGQGTRLKVCLPVQEDATMPAVNDSPLAGTPR